MMQPQEVAGWATMALALAIGATAIGMRMNAHVQTTMWRHVVLRLMLVMLSVIAVGQGWMLAHPVRMEGPPQTAPLISAADRPATGVEAGAPHNVSVAPGREAKGWPANRTLRVILWLNLVLALPWMTAPLVRLVLDYRSNGLSFALLTGYVCLDLFIGILLPSFSFKGVWGAMVLVTLLAACTAYNYWASETIAGMWARARRRH